jgi:hypothetical protein
MSHRIIVCTALGSAILRVSIHVSWANSTLPSSHLHATKQVDGGQSTHFDATVCSPKGLHYNQPLGWRIPCRGGSEQGTIQHWTNLVTAMGHSAVVVQPAKAEITLHRTLQSVDPLKRLPYHTAKAATCWKRHTLQADELVEGCNRNANRKMANNFRLMLYGCSSNSEV